MNMESLGEKENTSEQKDRIKKLEKIFAHSLFRIGKELEKKFFWQRGKTKCIGVEILCGERSKLIIIAKS